VTRLLYIIAHASLPKPLLLSQIYPNYLLPLTLTIYYSYKVIPYRLLYLINKEDI
jgi:hypothetical protein